MAKVMWSTIQCLSKITIPTLLPYAACAGLPLRTKQYLAHDSTTLAAAHTLTPLHHYTITPLHHYTVITLCEQARRTSLRSTSRRSVATRRSWNCC